MIHIFLLLIIFVSNSVFGALSSSLLFCIYLFLSIFLQVRSRGNWITPLFFFKVYLLISTLANYQIISLYRSGIILRSYSYARADLFDMASLIWIMGNIVLIAGFDSRSKMELPKIKWNVQSKNGLNTLFYLSAALVFRNFWLPISLPGTLNSIFYLVPLLSILFLARLGELTSSRNFFIKAFLLTVICTGHNVLYAYLRAEMIIPIIVFFVGILSAGKKIAVFASPKFYPLYSFLFVFLLFFETFGAQRTDLSVGFGRLTELRQVQNSNSEVDRFQRLTAFERASTVGQISAVCGLVQDNGFYQGRASSPLVVSLIPRFLWPEKPKIALGVWFALEIGAALKTKNWYNNSINMTIPGNLFLDFGWIGLIIGSFLIGKFLRLLWSTVDFNNTPLNFTGSLFGGYLIYTCFTGLGADLQILITMLALYLMIIGLSWILNRSNPVSTT